MRKISRMEEESSEREARVTEENWKTKTLKKSKGFLKRVAPFVLGLIVIVWYVNKRENDNEKKRVEISVARERAQRSLAARLRNAVVIPEVDTSFVLTATERGSQLFVVQAGYCTYAEPENPAESFVLTNQNGRFKLVPGDGFVDAGRTKYFSVESYGGPTTDVRVWVFKRTPQGICTIPNRESA